MIAALTGLARSGMSTLFSAVSGKEPHPGKAGQADEAVVIVPDHRFEWLVSYYKPRKVVNATINCIDLPGIDTGDDAGRSMAGKILGKARCADMLVMVVRAFGEGAGAPADPERDFAALSAELMLADLEMVEGRIGKLEKEIGKASKFEQQKKDELHVQMKLRETLEKEMPASAAGLAERELEIVRSLGILTLKPLMAVVNVGDDMMGRDYELRAAAASGIPVMTVCASFEKELSLLDPGSRKEFMEELGIAQSAAGSFAVHCYEAMGLISFLTVGEDEVRAWPIRKGTVALEAAGKVHSDIQRGFIRAETMAYDELREYGSEKALKAAGRVRLEGKDYVVKDGDIISYRFNV